MLTWPRRGVQYWGQPGTGYNPIVLQFCSGASCMCIEPIKSSTFPKSKSRNARLHRWLWRHAKPRSSPEAKIWTIGTVYPYSKGSTARGIQEQTRSSNWKHYRCLWASLIACIAKAVTLHVRCIWCESLNRSSSEFWECLVKLLQEEVCIGLCNTHWWLEPENVVVKATLAY